MAESMRPRTISQIAAQAVAASRAFDPAVREFLDAWQDMNADDRQKALAAEPALIGPVQDAYLAALAEHLSLAGGWVAPSWTRTENRFLRQPFFAGGLESLKAILLVESPLAFRRRLIFVSADALTRPCREFAAVDV